MKKVRDIPPEWQEQAARIQTPEYQEHLRFCVEEEGQTTFVKSFLNGAEDTGYSLSDLHYQIMADCLKPVPADLDEKHSLWEEGDDVCVAYGILTHRGLIRWYLQPGQKGTWLMARLTDKGNQILEMRPASHSPSTKS